MAAPPARIVGDVGPGGKAAELLREYVSAEEFRWSDYLRSLPPWIDDTTRDFGEDLYERMQLDPQVAKCVNIIKMGVLSQGVHITPTVDEEDPKYPAAKEVADFCKRNLAGLEAPFGPQTTVSLYWQLWDLLDAVALGSKVAEQVYEVPPAGQDKGRLCLKALKTRPRRSTAFVVDVHMNVVGLLGIIPGVAASVLTGTMVAENAPNILPRRKFAIMSVRPKDGDPRGQSMCRPAYNAWWLKQQAWPEYLKYLAQFATPSLIGYTAPEAAEVEELDATGSPVYDEDTGFIATVKPEQVMLAALVKLRNGSAAAFPNGSKVDPLQVGQSTTSEFTQFFKLANDEIANAILCQTLATEEGKYQTRAASGDHQDILSLTIDHVRQALVSVLRCDVLRNLVEWNYGPDALDLVPEITLAGSEKHDFKEFASAVAALMTAGYLDPSQYKRIDSYIGLPERTDESVEMAIEGKKMAHDQAKAAAAAGTAAGVPPGEPPPPGGPPSAKASGKKAPAGGG